MRNNANGPRYDIEMTLFLSSNADWILLRSGKEIQKVITSDLWESLTSKLTGVELERVSGGVIAQTTERSSL